MNWFDIISPLIASGFTWFLTKRKYETEVDQGQLGNTKEAINIWKELAMDLRKELELAKTEFESEIRGAKDEIVDLRKRLLKFENEHK